MFFECFINKEFLQELKPTDLGPKNYFSWCGKFKLRKNLKFELHFEMVGHALTIIVFTPQTLRPKEYILYALITVCSKRYTRQYTEKFSSTLFNSINMILYQQVFAYLLFHSPTSCFLEMLAKIFRKHIYLSPTSFTNIRTVFIFR